MKRLLNWLPLIAMLLASAAVLAIYLFTEEKINKLIVAQIILCAFIPAILPIVGIAFKRRFSVILNALIASHVFLSINLGKGLAFYYHFPWWDLFLHGYFGFVCCPLIFCLLILWNGERLNKIGFYITIFAYAIALAGLWEVYEYITDNLFGNDAQGVQGYVPGEGGPSPVADTMEDIMITAAGVAAFYLCVFIDKLNGYVACKALCKTVDKAEK